MIASGTTANRPPARHATASDRAGAGPSDGDGPLVDGAVVRVVLRVVDHLHAGERDDEHRRQRDGRDGERPRLGGVAAEQAQRDADGVAQRRRHGVRVELRRVEVADRPHRRRERDRDRRREDGEADEAGGEADGRAREAEATAALGHRVVVVLAAAVEVDVAVLHVGGVDGEERRAGVHERDRRVERARPLARQRRAEQRRRHRGQHEHRVDLRGVRAGDGDGPVAVTGECHAGWSPSPAIKRPPPPAPAPPRPVPAADRIGRSIHMVGRPTGRV
ncbi:hypothetical protein [Halobaculum litoreum]|uniref:hypothetical protein n=1 Tax=Halobaculum litoreum TaxID=3031998 RepID=UPI002AA2B64C|nr:hypothetical protein [Halobaculum sp. DT92]